MYVLDVCGLMFAAFTDQDICTYGLYSMVAHTIYVYYANGKSSQMHHAKNKVSKIE